VSLSKSKIKDFLKENREYEFESWAIARDTNCNQSTVNDLLKELEKECFVKKRELGYYTYWQYCEPSKTKKKLITKRWDRNLDI